jgi:hypothetical protein
MPLDARDLLNLASEIKPGRLLSLPADLGSVKTTAEGRPWTRSVFRRTLRLGHLGQSAGRIDRLGGWPECNRADNP